MRWWGRTSAKGFTIVELLVVIVIIAILASVVVVGYIAVVNNANDQAVESDLTKIADQLTLKSLDDNSVPPGGATSAGGGNATLLAGVKFGPQVNAYDKTVRNLYYCSGELSGVNQFSLVAKSSSGKNLIYNSESGVDTQTSIELASVSNAAVCQTIGYSNPFTWSYGYNPPSSTGWSAWATSN